MRSIATPGLAFFLLIAGCLPAQDGFGPEHLERARRLHQRAIVVDTHSDVTPKLENPEWDFAARKTGGHMDLPRMREGGLDLEFFSVYMGRTPGDGRAIKTALGRIDAVHEAARRWPDQLEVAYTVADVRRIKKAGKVAAMMGIEGGHIIESNLAALRLFHRLGCRYMSLTHSFNTEWADSSGSGRDVVPEHGGLTAFGEKIVREMNRLGMMVDISHVSDETFFDALRVSKAPLIASHSSVDGVFPHRRNMSDEMLQGMRRCDGVVMINFFNGYIDPAWKDQRAKWNAEHKPAVDAIKRRTKANLGAYYEQLGKYQAEHPLPKSKLVVLARHVEYVAKKIGWRHVGIGADWDGVPSLPEGMDHCGMLPNLSALLLARGAREQDLELFLGENLLRVLERCEAVAREMAAGKPR